LTPLSIISQGILATGSTSSIQFQGNVLGNTTSIGVCIPQGITTLNGGGTAANPQLFEVASQDVGNINAGFLNNFVFGELTLGGSPYAKLVNQSDNAPGSGPEALYVNSLIVPAGATLNLNGFHLYAKAAQVSGTILGGSIIQLPDSGPLTIGVSTPG